MLSILSCFNISILSFFDSGGIFTKDIFLLHKINVVFRLTKRDAKENDKGDGEISHRAYNLVLCTNLAKRIQMEFSVNAPPLVAAV